MLKSDGKEIRDYIDKAVKKHVESNSYKIARQSIKDTIENMIIGEFYQQISGNVDSLMQGLYEGNIENRFYSIIRKRLPTSIIYVNEVTKIADNPPSPLKPLNVKEFFIPQITPLVYFLCKENRIVYIGQTVNIWSRIPCHIKDKNFDRIFYMDVRKEDLNKTENALIEYYDPEYNKTTKQIGPKHERQRR